MSTITLQAVSKTFSNTEAPSLLPTSLTIEAGSFVTILGASGCGKTTLLKLINRLHEPTAGAVRIDGKDIASIPETELRRSIGYVIQQTGLFQHMTIAQNIGIVPEILGWKKPAIAERVDELLSLIGLEATTFRNRYPRQLSGGQQQRVGLARALAGNPDILLMDEPFGAIDSITRHRLQDELLNIQSKLRKTVIFVTHDVQEALKLGDKVIIMNAGAVQQYDTPRVLLDTPANDFVRELIGADDLYRRFDLISAKDVMSDYTTETAQTKASEDSAQRVGENQNLNEALQSLLMTSRDYILVEDQQRQPVGRITLDVLKKMRQRLQRTKDKDAPKC